MSPETIFSIHLVLGYVAWLVCFGVYFLPRLKAMDQVEAQRAIAATVHSFRFFGLCLSFQASWAPICPDFATGVLAILEHLTVRIRSLFWLFVVAFNLVGVVDLILDYYHATQVGLPALAGQLGATYAIPISTCPY
jgi:hypothetical protein